MRTSGLQLHGAKGQQVLQSVLREHVQSTIRHLSMRAYEVCCRRSSRGSGVASEYSKLRPAFDSCTGPTLTNAEWERARTKLLEFAAILHAGFRTPGILRRDLVVVPVISLEVHKHWIRRLAVYSQHQINFTAPAQIGQWTYVDLV